MSPPRVDAAATRVTGAVRPLLGSAFGFFVWAAHFLVVYIATAVACQLGLGKGGASVRKTFLTALAIVTVAAAAIVTVHALRRYRRWRDAPEQQFRMSITIGADAIAAVSITWQLIAILLVPICA